MDWTVLGALHDFDYIIYCKILVKFEFLLMSVHFPQASHGNISDNFNVDQLLLTTITF